MNQINMSKSLASRKQRNLCLVQEHSTGCFPLASLSRPPSVNRESFSVRQRHQIHKNPKSKQVNNEADLLLSVEKQDKLDIHNLLLSFNKSQLLEVLEQAAIVHPGILDIILSFVDHYPSHRKIFVRSLGPKTTSESLHNFFSSEYGEVEEAKVIVDKATGNSKGYGFVTFKNAESFLLALENPSKKIEGFVSFTSICVEPDSSAKNNARTDGEEKEKLKRKIRVDNVPTEMSSDTLLDFFEEYGEIEEGPWGFDMGTGKSKGFAYLLYKNEESSKAALAEKEKIVDGFRLVCKKVVKERERITRNVGWGLVESLPVPLRVMVMPVFYHYYVHHFRELVTHNYYQNQLVMGGGQGGQFGTGIQGPSSSSASSSIPGPAPYIAGGSGSGASSSGK